MIHNLLFPGRYLHMMDVLKPIASEIFKRVTELVDLYVFVVFNFFTEDIVRGERLSVEVVNNPFPPLDGAPRSRNTVV